LGIGAASWIRTSDQQLRRLMLYPTELLLRILAFLNYGFNLIHRHPNSVPVGILKDDMAFIHNHLVKLYLLAIDKVYGVVDWDRCPVQIKAFFNLVRNENNE
jgi:hypothetical protein